MTQNKPINRTPAHLRCSMGGCPAVYEIEGDGLLIVGALASTERLQSINVTRTELDMQAEEAIVIGKEYFPDLVQAIATTDDPLCVHPDFEMKAKEIAVNYGHGADNDWTKNLTSAISTALRDAYENGKMVQAQPSQNIRHCVYLITDAVLSERWACAKIADECELTADENKIIAARIRARGDAK